MPAIGTPPVLFDDRDVADMVVSRAAVQGLQLCCRYCGTLRDAGLPFCCEWAGLTPSQQEPTRSLA
jgi:hypothetical protein